MPVSTVQNQVPQTAAGLAGGRLNQDFDQFLRLLVTQMQNQDPLEPMDSTEFTNQLVQFSNVEQQIKTNGHLESLLSMQTLNLTALGVSFIGKNVEIEGKYFSMNGASGAKMSYGLPETATAGNITILDEGGHVVYTRDAELSAGKHEFTWDGRDMDGDLVPAGKYELRVGALAGTLPLNPSTFVPGYVNGLESAEDGTLLLNVGGELVPMAGVSKIFESPST